MKKLLDLWRPRSTAPLDVAPTAGRSAPAPWPGVYLGESMGWPICAGPQTAALILGPPRSGKTTSVIIPSVASAPGAVVTTSTKTDVLAVTARLRYRRGTCWIFDPSNTTQPLSGCQAVRWSPLRGCADWDEAIARAAALAGAARPGGDTHESPHWRERAEALLAALLHAAALRGLDMSAVLKWVLRHDVDDAFDIFRSLTVTLAADVLAGITSTEERERSGIFSTAAGILGAYRSAAVLDTAKTPNFDPDRFVLSSDTLYICAPAMTQTRFAPLVVALLEQIRHATYRRAGAHPPVVWALDEVANIAPLPLLPEIVSEGAGQGLVTLACLQDLAQARVRWGEAADGFLSLFGAKLILPGIGDMRTLQLISALAGDYDAPIRSTSTGRTGRFPLPVMPTKNTTWSTQRQPRLPVDLVAHGRPGHALAILGPRPPAWIRMTPWWENPWRSALAAL